MTVAFKAAFYTLRDLWRHVMISPVRDLPWSVRGKVGPVDRERFTGNPPMHQVYSTCQWLSQHDAELAQMLWELYQDIPQDDSPLGPVSQLRIVEEA